MISLSLPILNTAVAAISATLISLIVGFVIGWIVSSLFFKKQVNKNPPISEKQIRELYRQAGKQLSERQIMQIMNNLKNST